MRTMKIAIVEDEKAHAQLLQSYIAEWTKDNYIHARISIFSSAEKFLFFWEDNLCLGALFLDIQMPGMDGVELAKKIREQNRDIAIVFTTGMTDYLQEGYEVAALHYLVKPLEKAKVWDCMERICGRQESGKSHIFMLEAEVEETGEKCSVRFTEQDIHYLEAAGHYTRVCTDKAVFRVKRAIRQWEQELDEEAFVFSHRSYLVNLLYVSQINRKDLVLDDGERIPLSRRNIKAFHDAFIQFYDKDCHTKEEGTV